MEFPPGLPRPPALGTAYLDDTSCAGQLRYAVKGVNAFVRSSLQHGAEFNSLKSEFYTPSESVALHNTLVNAAQNAGSRLVCAIRGRCFTVTCPPKVHLHKPHLRDSAPISSVGLAVDQLTFHTVRRLTHAAPLGIPEAKRVGTVIGLQLAHGGVGLPPLHDTWEDTYLSSLLGVVPMLRAQAECPRFTHLHDVLSEQPSPSTTVPIGPEALQNDPLIVFGTRVSSSAPTLEPTQLRRFQWVCTHPATIRTILKWTAMT